MWEVTYFYRGITEVAQVECSGGILNAIEIFLDKPESKNVSIYNTITKIEKIN